MLEIEVQEGDDPVYIESVTHLILGALHDSALDTLNLVRVNSWFDRKWLGYSGNGAMPAFQYPVGLVKEEFRSSPATAPPLTPNRIDSQGRYRWCPYNERFLDTRMSGRIHRPQRSSENLRRYLEPTFGEGLYVWYCGQTEASGRGCLLLYAVRESGTEMAYVSLAQDCNWVPNAVQGASLDRVLLQLKMGAERRAERNGRIPSEEDALTARLTDAIEDGRLVDVVEAVASDVELDRPDERGHTPLTSALCEGRWEIAEYLLKAGANPFQQSVRGIEALHACVLSRSHADQRMVVAQELVAAGVQLELPNFWGYTPLLMAAELCDYGMVEFLLDAGANLLAKTPNGGTPLHVAAGAGDVRVMGLLLDRGAKVSARDKGRSTPLLYAAVSGHPACVEELYRRGASLETRGGGGKGITALEVARRFGHEEVVRLIESLQGTRA